MIRATVHFSGTVQGVGFRFATQTVARRHGITGIVQNLDDGRVRMVAEGNEQVIREMPGEIGEVYAGIRIADAQWEIGKATGEFASFTILR